MPEKYRLVYWDMRAGAEPIRYIFAIAGVPYEDVRIHFDLHDVANLLKKPTPLPDEWVDRVPYGKLPMLEINDGDRRIVSAKPICRYLASKFNLAPEDNFLDSKCDEYMDALADFGTLMKPMFLVSDIEERGRLLDKIVAGPMVKYFSSFDKIIKENNGQNLVGDRITWADVYLAHVVDNFVVIHKLEIYDDYPSLANLVKSVLTIPGVQEWIERRPKSVY